MSNQTKVNYDGVDFYIEAFDANLFSNHGEKTRYQAITSDGYALSEIEESMTVAFESAIKSINEYKKRL